MNLKWQKTNRGVDGIHDAEADLRKGSNPTFLVTTYMISDGLVNCLVSAFTGAVRLRMVRSQKSEFDTSKFVQGSPEFGNEKFVTIGDKFQR